MARVTVEDCIDKVDNRFDLVLLAAHRARMISSGSQLTIDRDNDKNPVVSLREIAESTISPEDLREELERARETLKTLPAHRPTGTVNGEIEAFKQNNRWMASGECTNATSGKSMAYCEGFYKLKAELAIGDGTAARRTIRSNARSRSTGSSSSCAFAAARPRWRSWTSATSSSR